MYYKPGSLKAKNCIDGYRQLVNFCKENDIPFELCGKIVVATEQRELDHLNRLFERGKANGLDGLKKLTGDELKEYEPYVEGIAGIHVPQTGIVDYKLVAQKYGELIVTSGGDILLDHKVNQIDHERRILETNQGTVDYDLLINCAGLFSDQVALMTNKDLPLRIVPFRGEYYQLKDHRSHLVRNLIYPVPDPNFPFLGVHFTRMINGGIEAGPNAVLAMKREGYSRKDYKSERLEGNFAVAGLSGGCPKILENRPW